MHVTQEEGARPIKAWTDDIEPMAMEQAKQLARLPFIAPNGVALMPDCHAGIGSTVGTVIATDRAVVPAAVGVDIGCFVGETKIPLLDGSQKTLAELANRTEPFEPFWVYSIDANQQVAPGRAIAVKTRENADLVVVTVSGGEEIICTPDHPFMLNDGTYREAKDLRFNASLMPLYRRWQTRDGYESVSNGKGTSKQTHVMVWEAFNGPVLQGHVVHHADHIHFNNQPGNLALMTTSDHSTHHRRVGRKFDNASPVFRQKRMEGIRRRKEDPAQHQQMAEVGAQNIAAYMRDRPEEYKAAVAGNGKRGAPYLTSFNTAPRPCKDCDHVSPNPAAHRWHVQREHAFNHKVLSVRPAGYTADVYCLQVEEHHNFALAAGVFVHNCGMNAVRTSLRASDLPESLKDIRHQIERDVPLGPGGKNQDDGKVSALWSERPNLLERFHWIKGPDVKEETMARQLGSLGSGNHFIELCLDENDDVWIMLHSGSRGTGNRIGMHYIEKARREAERWMIQLPDQDLAYLPEGSEHFDAYMAAVDWAQAYALENRAVMMDVVLAALRRYIRVAFTITHEAVNCFPEGVSVSASGIRNGFGRRYAGELLTIETASGNRIPVTPNHPFLTARGWVAAKDISDADYLVRAKPGYAGACVALHPNVNSGPAEIAQAVRSLGVAGKTRRVSGRAVEFHGDTGFGNRQVDVVSVDGELRFGEDAAFLKQIAKLGFANPDAIRSGRPSNRLLAEFIPSRFAALRGMVRLSGERAALLVRQLAHADAVGVLPTSQFNTSATQDLGQPRFGASNSGGQGVDALAGKVSLDRVLKIEGREWSGHVYNLSADAGYYMVEGFIVSNCHHNYVEKEHHFGKNLWITRKGAIRAREGDLGIIPGSMGQRSYIVRGKGNLESYCSCSHGAGRRMSRTQARKQFTVEDLAAQTEGVECRKDASVLDEIPSSYKSIDEVMANQTDLVEVVHTLKQVLCVKGG